MKGFDEKFWIGGTRIGNPSSLYWFGLNKGIVFTNWAPEEPNNLNGLESCMEIAPIRQFKWNDAKCSDMNYFVCEQETEQ